MTTTDQEMHGALADQTRSAWQRFVETFEPLRPDLYRYARYLTRNAWDAEDLVQDTLARAMVAHACLFQPIDHPRAWLFRIASNLWIDRQRRHREEPTDLIATAAPDDRLSLEGREAGATLIARLSPQERAAVLLKDVFDFSIEETAGVLTTSPGAIKAALHRGRGKLAADAPPAPPRVAAAVVDSFCEAFNARDLDRLVALLLDTATAEVVGVAVEYGPAKMRQPDTGSLYHSLNSPIAHAVAAVWREGDRGGIARVERRVYHDEPVLIAWYDHDDGPVVRDVIRIASDDDRVAGVRFYFFCPDVVAEVCGELAVPWRSNGYRYW